MSAAKKKPAATTPETDVVTSVDDALASRPEGGVGNGVEAEPTPPPQMQVVDPPETGVPSETSGMPAGVAEQPVVGVAGAGATTRVRILTNEAVSVLGSHYSLRAGAMMELDQSIADELVRMGSAERL